jgi:large repetitive protein
LRWSAGATPPGLTFSPATATVAGVPTTIGEFDMPLTVEDSRGQRGSQVFRVVIQAARISLLRDPQPPAGVVGQAYSHTLRANDGEPPYAWAVSAPALPAGLTLDPSSGTIRGVPRVAGTSRFSVTVQDRAADTDSAAFAILIEPATLRITPATPPSGTVGTPYAFTFEATGGIQPYRWSIATDHL